MRTRNRAVMLSALVVLPLLVNACADSPRRAERKSSTADFTPAPVGPSWAPAPKRVGALSALAQVRGDRYLLHTRHGDVDFLPGVNLGSTTPGYQPGELHITAADVRRWLPLMRRMGLRVVRVYTIMPPHFYTELASYNSAHRDAPLYLLQGAFMPKEAVGRSGDLYDKDVTGSFTHELRDAVAAVHGELSRGPAPGRASGTWTADVSPWLAGWIVGVELDPEAVKSTDSTNAKAPAYAGRYFRSAGAATPTERWLARRFNELATAEARHGQTQPVAFVNWPTLDPLKHPEEPRDIEDLVGVDAKRVVATGAWPGGTFASFHAYPYYPDFQRYEPGLQVKVNGVADPYAAYLRSLKRHFTGMPLMISEFGVPSSLGTAHLGPRGRGQGNHTEQAAMAIDASLLRMIRKLRLAGAQLFVWADEWFKKTWNTEPRQIPADRRQLWHDPLTNEQYFGLLANDPVGGEDAAQRTIADEATADVRVGTDESWVHLNVATHGGAKGQVILAFDVVPGGAARLPGTGIPAKGADFAVVFDLRQGTARAWVRAGLDPVMLDNLHGTPIPAAKDGWRLQQLTINGARAIPSTGRKLPAEFFDVGLLRRGEMDPGKQGYNSLATWRVDGRTITLRMPWGLLGMADPSSKTALIPKPDRSAGTMPVQRIGMTVYVDSREVGTDGIAWQPWQRVYYQERVKAGIQTFVDAVTAVTPR